MFVFDSMKFLENYKLQPCLWDKKNPDFKNRESRESAEEVLLPISGLASVKELRAKIRSLRCTYNQEFNKVKISLRNGGKVYTPKLQWFSLADSFLKKNREDDYIDFEFNIAEDSHAQKEEMRIVKPEYDYIMRDDIPVLFPPECLTEMNSTKRMKNAKTHSKKFKSHIFPEISTKPDRKSNAPYEFGIFGQHVATQLSKLPLKQALMLQEDIQRLITKARLSVLASSEVPEARIRITPISSSGIA